MSFGFTSRGGASVKQLDAAFAESDTSGSGTLDAPGVHECLLAISGSRNNPAQAGLGHERVAMLLPRYDSNNDGRLTLPEVKRLHAYLQKGHNVRDEIFEVYRTLSLMRVELADARAGRPQRAVYEPVPTIRAWLEGLKAGLGRYAAAFTAIGIEDLCDLIDSNETEATQIQSELRRHDPKPYHERRIVEAMQAARRAGGAASAPPGAMPPKAVRIEDPPPPPRVASAKLASANNMPGASKSALVRQKTSGRLGPGSVRVRASNVRRPSEAAPTRCDGPSVREWLDEVRSGFASKFACAFEDFGIEFRSDLSSVDAQLSEALFEQLHSACGAKELHRTVLMKALTGVGADVGTRAKAAAHTAGTQRWQTTGKRFAAFVSHHKKDAAMEARFLKEKLEAALHAEIFLDSDQLQDLRLLLDHVRQSEVVVLVQSAEVLLRPWCILEIHAAVSANIPIIAVSLRGKAYDFAEARHVLTYLDTELERRNPGASKILQQNGVQVIDAAFMLANVVPNIISVEFDPCASSSHIQASVDDLLTEIDRLRQQPAAEIHIGRAEWLEQRGDGGTGESHAVALHHALHGEDSSPAANCKCARLPPELPVLPKGYVVREALLAGLKNALLVTQAVGAPVEPEQGAPLDLAGMDETMVLAALEEAAAAKRVLLVIDDAWALSQVHSLSCLDATTWSAAVVTTRIQGLVPGAPSIPLGVLESDAAIALLLETAGALAVPPYDPRLYDAVEACGRLPLTLAVAGSLLEQFGGKISDEYLGLLTEDRGEALREGEFGDMHVRVEDRIITATLENFKGGESPQVRALFFAMAIFPEDVPVPPSLFTLLATTVFGASGKRPGLQVRSWLTALIRLSLVIGSLADGVFMHDIVRDYAMSRCEDLRAQQRAFLEALLEAAPEGGWPPPWQAGAFDRDSPERYVATFLHWHLRAAVERDSHHDDLMERFAGHSTGFGFTLVSALGRPQVVKWSKAAEQRGDFRAAAQYVNGVAALFKEGDGSREGAVNMEAETKEIYRGIQLFAREDDSAPSTPSKPVDRMELMMCTRALQCAVTLTGIFSEPSVVDFCKRRYDSLTERLQVTAGHTYEFQRDLAKTRISDVCRELFMEFDGDFDVEAGMEDLSTRVIRSWGKAFKERLRLLTEYAKMPMERCYAMATALFVSDIGMSNRLYASCFFDELEGIEDHRALIRAVGGAQGVFEALSSYVDVYFEREIEGDLWDWWCLCCGGQIFSATAEIDLLGQLVDLHVASHEKLELRRREGLQVNMRAIEAYYRFWMVGTLCIKLGMMAFAERLSTIHARDSWGGALQFFNECWRVGLGHVFGQELNRKGGETYMKAVNLLELFLVHGDEPEGAVRALIGDVAKVVEQNRQVAIGLIWPASGYSLAECWQLDVEASMSCA